LQVGLRGTRNKRTKCRDRHVVRPLMFWPHVEDWLSCDHHPTTNCKGHISVC
jgi:hypothetical protein